MDVLNLPLKRECGQDGSYIVDTAGTDICIVRGNYHQDRAAYIVTAVNSHAELVAACKAVLDAIETSDLAGEVLWINPPHQLDGVHETATERLRAALKKAGVTDA